MGKAPPISLTSIFTMLYPDGQIYEQSGECARGEKG
nr:MAG TPA: hypothetical protein [Caudoviricetes sp.]DAW09495.1 MAG TPA: hypothetical protein [Caudoviricetes sp.]